jgi:periplasmic protein CpxP/Spy
MPRASKRALVPVLAAGFAALAVAAAPASAAVPAGAAEPRAATFGQVVPAQMQQQPNVDSNLTMLHQRLGITAAQEPAFDAFANVMRENARTVPSGAPPQSADAVEQLRLSIRYAQQAVDGMRRMLPALEGLYAVLSAQQRAVADQIFRQGPGR